MTYVVYVNLLLLNELQAVPTVWWFLKPTNNQ